MLDNLMTKKFLVEEAKRLHPLQLALIGDAVFELFIRNYILCINTELNAHKIHVEAINYVKAHGQSEIIKSIEDELTEDEIYIFKRGRNAKSPTVPKNADVTEYRYATGFEALVGYLYLTDNQERLKYILEKSIENFKKNRRA
ncbi:ribonuclease-3 family protein [Clostridium amylolyticum]|uniref:Mini-ribonuclease 3 n=1 Tax=Clostridium amylolyticum TaxID=1121298 RepID=A0A1M6JW05_9CLOT|nr:ribonuclease III domain-containing protein [Clostridium amylolyticum]SHJ50891.1 ribonuclease-3 family protein [Clostridium amylolyticum]